MKLSRNLINIPGHAYTHLIIIHHIWEEMDNYSIIQELKVFHNTHECGRLTRSWLKGTLQWGLRNKNVYRMQIDRISISWITNISVIGDHILLMVLHNSHKVSAKSTVNFYWGISYGRGFFLFCPLCSWCRCLIWITNERKTLWI